MTGRPQNFSEPTGRTWKMMMKETKSARSWWSMTRPSSAQRPWGRPDKGLKSKGSLCCRTSTMLWSRRTGTAVRKHARRRRSLREEEEKGRRDLDWQSCDTGQLQIQGAEEPTGGLHQLQGSFEQPQQEWFDAEAASDIGGDQSNADQSEPVEEGRLEATLEEEDEWWGDGPEDLLYLAQEMQNGAMELTQYQMQQILRSVAVRLGSADSGARTLADKQDAACDAWYSYLQVAEKGIDRCRSEGGGNSRVH